jgi:hypothetical protein
MDFNDKDAWLLIKGISFVLSRDLLGMHHSTSRQDANHGEDICRASCDASEDTTTKADEVIGLQYRNHGASQPLTLHLRTSQRSLIS